jgi:arginyl-tRNA--protein-N-Asp/Glu arginylyltransferase
MYLAWDEKTVANLADADALYDAGYVLTRKGRGVLQQTRSVRIRLSEFALSSENRRIVKKTESLSLAAHPIPYADYHWSVGKMAKDFYETKFGAGVFSANKIKEILTDGSKTNFNLLLSYAIDGQTVGYAVCVETPTMLHYAYPFYDLAAPMPNIGLGMMLRAILYAQKTGKSFAYLGSARRPADAYKLQFSGIEWWDGAAWSIDGARLKKELSGAGIPAPDQG